MTSTETVTAQCKTFEGNAQIKQDRVSGRDVLWKPDLYTITSALKAFSPPILVKVDEGMMIENDALESEEILTIYGERKVQQIQALDQFDRQLCIPTECVHKVVVRTFSDEMYKTIREICNAAYRPHMVMNTKAFKFYGLTFDIGTQFEIQSVHMENNEPAGLRVISMSPCHRITLPVAARGDFREILLPSDREKEYLIKDVTTRKFPLAIGFLPTKDKNSLYGPHLGRVILKKCTEVDIISATVHQAGRDIYKTFPRQLDAVVKVGITVDGTHDYSCISKAVSDFPDVYVDMKPKHPHLKSIPENKGQKPMKDHGNTRVIRSELERPKLENEYKEDHSLPTPAMPGEKIHDILRTLNLQEYTTEFKRNQINTQLAKSLRKKSLTSELNMTSFEAMKLRAYLDGWRPLYERSCSRPHQVVEKNPLTWTVEEVHSRMKQVALSSFAAFCFENQVDGSLLLQIVDPDILESIREEHGMALTGIQQTRLEEYVKGWRPDSS